ncbi:peptidoglycan DD-metalloendopeptidase family protein [uncultured Acetatifactor sp.]|uniref:peptidoglycan DD-metalloendopeptidase family protein n=1 Tax=uncultured Acetatifactor sp. TaxID=1671927 RepID=UPI00260662C4|nr:peptidoglycan DD-metalloendopeptidase family protein [uncultured Acetatifactor sp.]
MRKNRRNNAKKERTIMIASSVFVLAALTMTGIYMKSNNTEEQGDGYTIDFTALEDNVEDKHEEIAQNKPVEEKADTKNESADKAPDATKEVAGKDDDLDYLPMEAGSPLVTIPGLTDGVAEGMPEDIGGQDTIAQEPEVSMEKPEAGADSDADATATPDAPQEEAGAAEDTGAGEEADSTDGSAVAAPTPHFAESEGLLRPVSGEVLIPFSMDGGVYFSTLDQFKYNPALMIAAEQGAAVAACADGQVIAVFEDEEIGHALTVDLGDGYQITYGQLDAIQVAEGSYVEPGQVIGFIASPTKYFSVEGSNLYLKLTMNGAPVNPETLLQ